MLDNSMSLRLKVDNCRAVHSADIEIGGLTIVCGANGVGKSTIARILQDSIEVQLFYEGSIRLDAWKDMYNFTLLPLRNFLSVLRISLPHDDPITRMFNYFLDRRLDIHAWGSYYDELIQSISKVFAAAEWRNADVAARPFTQLCSVLGVADHSLKSLEGAVLQRVEASRRIMAEAKDAAITFEHFAQSITSPVLWEGEVSLFEKDELVWHYIDKESVGQSRLESVQNVFYIESPIVSIPQYENGCMKFDGNLCWFSLGGEHVPKQGGDEVLANFMRLTAGEVVLGKDQVGNPQWKFKRSDGAGFPLSLCASGFKSLAILSTLYKYNYLNKDALLIVDEPEAHLHPEWIVEYAAIIVRLVKDCGVRVLIASHNPDMVHALKSFSSAIGLYDQTKIYQAVPAKDGKPYQYDYVDTHLAIGEIFDTFNKVYDMVDAAAAKMKMQDNADA